jgi:hypothetical protein
MNSYGVGILGWVEIGLLVFSTGLFVCGWVPRLRSWRSLFWGACALAVITAVFPGWDNSLGQYLFIGSQGAPRIPLQLFGIAWWLLGAWLAKSLLDLVLRRTVFPDDNEPHARRLFADLVSALIYVVAFVGIMDRVFKQPLSGVLATSGVLAIVLGLALQSTLADVFSGLAINIDRAFAAGDWIAVPDRIAGSHDGDRRSGNSINRRSNGMQVLRPQNICCERERGKIVDETGTRESELQQFRLADLQRAIRQFDLTAHDRPGSRDDRAFGNAAEVAAGEIGSQHGREVGELTSDLETMRELPRCRIGDGHHGETGMGSTHVCRQYGLWIHGTVTPCMRKSSRRRVGACVLAHGKSGGSY